MESDGEIDIEVDGVLSSLVDLQITLIFFCLLLILCRHLILQTEAVFFNARELQFSAT